MPPVRATRTGRRVRLVRKDRPPTTVFHPLWRRSATTTTGNAAGSFPCGLAPEDGLPVGFQVMAPPLADDRVYRVGAALERALAKEWAADCAPLEARWLGSEA